MTICIVSGFANTALFNPNEAARAITVAPLAALAFELCGRHRVGNWVGEVQARGGGGGRAGVFWGRISSEARTGALSIYIKSSILSFMGHHGGVFVLKLELARFYIDIEQHSQLLVPTSHLHT